MRTTKALLTLTLAIASTAAASQIHVETLLTPAEHNAAVFGSAGPATYLAAYFGWSQGLPFSNFDLHYAPPVWDLSADLDLDFGLGPVVPQDPPPYLPPYNPPDKGGPPQSWGGDDGHHSYGPPPPPPASFPCDPPPPVEGGDPPPSVPEAGTSGLVLIGVSGLLWLRRRRGEAVRVGL